MATSHTQKFGFEKEIFLTAGDEKKIITEMATQYPHPDGYVR
jgi:hypothetical protein